VAVVNAAAEKYVEFGAYFPRGFSVYETGGSAKTTLIVS